MEEKRKFLIQPEGSLGLLAQGAIGIRALRKARREQGQVPPAQKGDKNA